jgi:hypothetical protein
LGAETDPFAEIGKLQVDKDMDNNFNPDEVIDEDTQSILDQTQEVSDFAENLSPIVSQSFAKIPNQCLSNEKLESLKGIYKPPENCKLLGVPKVNNEIWGNLPNHVKLRDAKLQVSQQFISRALVAKSRMMDMMLEVQSVIPKESFQQMLQVTMDASLSLGHVMRDMNIARRLNIKPSLQPQYAELCSARVPVDEKLFGENLDQSLKLVKSTANLIKPQMVTKSRFHPYSTGQRLNFQAPPRATGFRGGQSFRPRFGGFQRPVRPQFKSSFKQHQK